MPGQQEERGTGSGRRQPVGSGRSRAGRAGREERWQGQCLLAR